MTIGDVLGVAGLLLMFGICSWAIMTAAALLFPNRCQIAMETMEASPLMILLKGLGITVVVGVIGIAFLSSPLPPLKLVGMTIITGTLAIAAVGGGGLSKLLGQRMKALQPEMSDYGLICRGASLVFICALSPIIGWFLIGPAVLGMSVGAGVRAIFGRQVESVGNLS